jgi:N-acetylmuramoyl-L-alanine amidase
MRLRFFLPSVVVAGMTLAVPATASAYFVHVVAPGESLSSIAAQDGLSVAALAAANGLSPDTQLLSGSTVQIPPQGSSVVAPSTTAGTAGTTTSGDSEGDGDADDAGTSVPASTSTSGSYVVQAGDTLSAIAARAGESVDALAAANGLNPNAFLLTGTVLQLSSGSSSAVEGSSNAAISQPVGTPAQGTPTDPPYPTPERVTASQVGAVAAANGVPSSLADAIAWQESGFNNDLVSSADARGVMQILPGTWQWIQHTLDTGGPPLAPASAIDNVRGGVLMLHSLLGSTGGDPAMAAAGYYQGLPSVVQNGVYPSTQNYVNDVMALERQFGGGG